MATKIFTKTKVEIEDMYDRFVENEDITGVGIRYNSEEKAFKLTIPKARVRSDEKPEHLVDGEKTAMYFSRRKNGGYSFVMPVNMQLFKAIGVDAVAEEFKQSLQTFMDKVA